MQQLQIDVLDRERAVILKVINLGLDIKPLWCLTRPLIIALTPYMERRGHWEEWHQVLETAIRVAQERGAIEAETTLTSLLARLCQRMSRPDDVIKYYCRVIRLARRGQNLFEEARACSNLGYLYIDGGHWWRSEVLGKHALEIFDKLGNEHGQAHTHNHLGVLYVRLESWEKAETHLMTACDIWESMGDKHGLMRGYGNLGTLFAEASQSKRAIQYSAMALEQALQTGEEALTAPFLLNIGIAYLQADDFINAEQHLNRAAIVYQQFDELSGMAQVWHYLGLTHKRAGQDQKAYPLLDKALAMYRAINNIVGERSLLKDMREFKP